MFAPILARSANSDQGPNLLFSKFAARFHMSQFLQSTEEVLAALGPALFQQCRPLKVVVVLGAAVSRPLEAYELQYRQHADTVASENRDLPPSQSRDYCQEAKSPRQGLL